MFNISKTMAERTLRDNGFTDSDIALLWKTLNLEVQNNFSVSDLFVRAAKAIIIEQKPVVLPKFQFNEDARSKENEYRSVEDDNGGSHYDPTGVDIIG